jgi:hypothetical protein
LASPLNVLRSRDLLNLQLELINLRVDESGPRPVLRRDGAGDAIIVLRLPAQHVAEQAAATDSSPPTPFAARLSGPSRLAFRVTAGHSEVPLALADLLAVLETLPLELPGDPLDPAAATVVEFPDRLLLVPDAGVRLHRRSSTPRPGALWSELWQAALQDANGRSHFRAVANPFDRTERVPAATLTRQDRTDIVTRSTSDPAGPHVVVADAFVVSALGASARLRSNWTDGSTATTLGAWNHDARHGRDQYVRTIRDGFLFPFRHRASIETITRREIAGTPPLAALRQREEISIREFERTYSSRELPFRRVQLTGQPRRVDSGTHTVYEIEATVSDAAGTSINCVLTALFVPLHEARDADVLARIDADEYAERRDLLELRGQRIVLADPPDERGGTDFTVESMTLGAKILTPGEVGELDPLFTVVMKSARVRIPAVEQLQGVAGGTGSRAARRPVPIRLTRRYVEQGLDRADTKQVFAEIVEPIAGLSIPAERAGGLASPKFPDMDGVSRLMGPVSDVRNFAGADTPPIDPAALIGDTKLLGTIALKEIVDLSQASDLGFLTTQPERLFEKVVNEPDFVLRRPVISSVRTGSAIETRFVWKPKIKDALSGLLAQRDPPSGPADPLRPPGRMQLIVRGKMTLAPEAAAAELVVEGLLTNFVLSLAGMVKVDFNQVRFVSRTGKKMEVTTSIAKVGFAGPLAFAEEIRKAIPIGGFGDAGISPQPDGIVVKYGLQLPAVGLGVLSLQNIAFNSSLSLPFVENPVGIRFALSERGNPFIVSVAPFGGTGFFALEMRTSGPDRLSVEAAIEFGGIITFNLADIVKGGVYVLAGVYMLIRSGGSHEISAHLRIGGYVDVLGLISVSIELYLALTFDGSRLRGMARLTIGVKVLFFSKSFSFEVEKEIAHLGAIPGGRSPAGPRRRAGDFRSLVDRPQWESYCQAFA